MEKAYVWSLKGDTLEQVMECYGVLEWDTLPTTAEACIKDGVISSGKRPHNIKAIEITKEFWDEYFGKGSIQTNQRRT